MGCKKCKKSCQYVPVQGPQGPPGPPGLNGSASALLLSTGAITDVADLASELGVALGFGVNDAVLTGGLPVVFSVVPRAGTITGLSAEATLSIAGLDAAGGADITVTLLTSAPGTNTWTPTTFVSTITLADSAPVGGYTGSTATGSLAVTAGTKIAIIAVAEDTLTLAEDAVLSIGAGINFV